MNLLRILRYTIRFQLRQDSINYIIRVMFAWTKLLSSSNLLIINIPFDLNNTKNTLLLNSQIVLPEARIFFK